MKRKLLFPVFLLGVALANTGCGPSDEADETATSQASLTRMQVSQGQRCTTLFQQVCSGGRIYLCTYESSNPSYLFWSITGRNCR